MVDNTWTGKSAKSKIMEMTNNIEPQFESPIKLEGLQKVNCNKKKQRQWVWLTQITVFAEKS